MTTQVQGNFQVKGSILAAVRLDIGAVKQTLDAATVTLGPDTPQIYLGTSSNASDSFVKLPSASEIPPGFTQLIDNSPSSIGNIVVRNGQDTIIATIPPDKTYQFMLLGPVEGADDYWVILGLEGADYTPAYVRSFTPSPGDWTDGELVIRATDHKSAAPKVQAYILDGSIYRHVFVDIKVIAQDPPPEGYFLNDVVLKVAPGSEFTGKAVIL